MLNIIVRPGNGLTMLPLHKKKKMLPQTMSWTELLRGT
uniref:Uncharacterized protein n=1 Tax=Anguilla anguilla TaxID=7936 RepID=A0A0E9VU85_ANGAN